MILTTVFDDGDIVRLANQPDEGEMTVDGVYLVYRVVQNGAFLRFEEQDLELVERKCRHIRQSDPDYDGKAFPYTYCPLCGEKLR